MKGVSSVGEFVTVVGEDAGYVIRGARSMAFTEDTLDDVIDTLSRYRDHKEQREQSVQGKWTIVTADGFEEIVYKSAEIIAEPGDIKDLLTLLKRRFPEG